MEGWKACATYLSRLLTVIDPPGNQMVAFAPIEPEEWNQVVAQKPYSLSIKILLRDNRDRLLFLKRPEGGSWNPGKWDLPGGKLDPGENLQGALVREVKEETGLSISILDVHGAVADETDDFRVAHLVMTGVAGPGEVALSDEHEEYAWVSAEEIGGLALCGYLETLFS